MKNLLCKHIIKSPIPYLCPHLTGDLVLLASGSAVPADCVVNHGTIEVDQAALTGESLPVTMHQGSV